MGLIVDSGGLIAFDRGDRAVAALIEATRRRRERVMTSSGCVAQAWRGGGPGQALLARLLRGVEEVAIDDTSSRRVGELCGKAATRDIVDAHVATIARTGDIVITSDPEDIRALLGAAGSVAAVERC